MVSYIICREEWCEDHRISNQAKAASHGPEKETGIKSEHMHVSAKS